MFSENPVINRMIIVFGIWGLSSLIMMVGFLIHGLYYREQAVTLNDAIKAFFISLIPLSAPICGLMMLIFYLQDHGDKVIFRPKKAVVREMTDRMTNTPKTQGEYRGRLY